METKDNSKWDRRKYFIVQRWPLFSDKDLDTLKKHPENIVIKLQKIYHYDRYQAYNAYFELMKPNHD